jgi:hypothetical protein
MLDPCTKSLLHILLWTGIVLSMILLVLQCAAVHWLSRISHQCLPDGKRLYASKTVNEQSWLYLATLSTFPRIPYPSFVVLIETSCSLLVLAAYRVMAKGDGREVGDRERTGYSCMFISCSWYMREQLT